MSIENSLERIVAALEKLAGKEDISPAEKLLNKQFQVEREEFETTTAVKGWVSGITDKFTDTTDGKITYVGTGEEISDEKVAPPNLMAPPVAKQQQEAALSSGFKERSTVSIPPAPPVKSDTLAYIKDEGTGNTGWSEALKATPPAPPTMTAEELNNALVAEFNRIGSREPIDKVLREQYEVASITDLKPEQYQGLIDAVKAI